VAPERAKVHQKGKSGFWEKKKATTIKGGGGKWKKKTAGPNERRRASGKMGRLRGGWLRWSSRREGGREKGRLLVKKHAFG